MKDEIRIINNFRRAFELKLLDSGILKLLLVDDPSDRKYKRYSPNTQALANLYRWICPHVYSYTYISILLMFTFNSSTDAFNGHMRHSPSPLRSASGKYRASQLLYMELNILIAVYIYHIHLYKYVYIVMYVWALTRVFLGTLIRYLNSFNMHLASINPPFANFLTHIHIHTWTQRP